MRKISVSAHISLQYLHEDKAVQERQQAENQYIFNGGMNNEQIRKSKGKRKAEGYRLADRLLQQ